MKVSKVLPTFTVICAGVKLSFSLDIDLRIANTANINTNITPITAAAAKPKEIFLFLIRNVIKSISAFWYLTGSMPHSILAHESNPSIMLNIDLDIPYKRSHTQLNINQTPPYTALISKLINWIEIGFILLSKAELFSILRYK